MKKLFYLQLKKSFKLFPFVVFITVTLFLCAAIVFSGIMNSINNSEENKLFTIAVTGDTDDEYLKLGMSALRAMDDTRFTVEFIELDEENAKSALYTGEISAYIVLPENFIENALMGETAPIKYVTTPGAKGIISMFKNELTQVVTDLVISAEKGSYGIHSAITDNGIKDPNYKYLNMLSIRYVSLIFDRSDILVVKELGISNGLASAEYYLCGIAVVLVLLMGLPYVSVNVKSDSSFDRLLYSNGFSSFKLFMCEYLSHIISLLALFLALLIIILSGAKIFSFELNTQEVLLFALHLVPIIIMFGAFNIMIFELSDNTISAVLMHFVLSLSMCYVSGCFYPVHALPKLMQRVQAFLPTGIAREFLASAVTDQDYPLSLLLGISYVLIFIAVSVAFKRHKTVGKRGGI